MGLHQVPEFESSASSQDDNPLAGFRSQAMGQISVKPTRSHSCYKGQVLCPPPPSAVVQKWLKGQRLLWTIHTLSVIVLLGIMKLCGQCFCVDQLCQTCHLYPHCLLKIYLQGSE